MLFNLFLKDAKEIKLKVIYSVTLKKHNSTPTIIKVKNSPSTVKSKFLSKKPNKIIGRVIAADDIKKLKYFGFIGHFLFSNIKFKMVDKP